MPTATSSCELLHPFVDSELDAAGESLFRLHLEECHECRGELAPTLGLKGLMHGLRAEAAHRIESWPIPPFCTPWICPDCGALCTTTDASKLHLVIARHRETCPTITISKVRDGSFTALAAVDGLRHRISGVSEAEARAAMIAHLEKLGLEGSE